MGQEQNCCSARRKAPGVRKGSNPGEGMYVCKCIVPSSQEITLNSRRTASPLFRLVEGEERWGTSDHSQGVLPQNWGGNEQSRTVVLKAKTNNRCKNLALSCDEFYGPRSDVTV
ncbi:uncharacterized protein TNCV_2800421 [Trichonephila clavipes]|nr:uncharacterized protein TNCV_2800421 [Trichonephila clavipes]